MARSRTGRFIALLAALMLLAAACSNREEKKTSTRSGGGGSGGSGDSGQQSEIDTSNCPTDPTEEVKGDTIKLASSFPQSGLTAAFSEIAAGWKSYFKYTNDQGGVKIGGKKYKIETVDKDDEYNAQKTAQNIEEEVGTDGSKVFAVFGVVGTANNISIRQFLGENCVPNLFAISGSPAWGNPKFPWTIGATNDVYPLEGKTFAEYLKKNKPSATVAMLIQNDDFGSAYENGFRQAIKGTKIKLVKVEKYATGANEVGAQLTSLAATNADAFFDGATLLACPDALKKAQAANWKPIIWVSGTCISKTLMGIAGDAAEKAISITNLKDPFNPQFASDADLKLYRTTVKKYEPKADIENGIVAYGWTQGALMVKAMETAKKASRLEIMEAVRHQKDAHAGLLLDDVKINTDGEKDPYMGESGQVIQYDSSKKYFNNLGPMVDYEGKTKDFTPKQLIEG